MDYLRHAAARMGILAILFLSPFCARAVTFTMDDWSVSYNTCEGYLEVYLWYYEEDGAPDWMEYIDFSYMNNGVKTQFFNWVADYNQSYPCPTCTDSIQMPVHKFYYGFNYLYPKTTFDTVKIGTKSYMKVRLYDVPEGLLGNDIQVLITGHWESDGQNSEDNDFMDWQKSASTNRINPPTGLSATDNTKCDTVKLSWTNPQNNPCPNGDWSIEIWRDNAYLANAGKATSYNDLTAVDGQIYNYKIRALFKPNLYIEDYSAYTDENAGNSIGPLSPPTSVTASTTQCDGQIKVDWQWLNGSNPVNFLIERSTNPSSGFILLSNTLSGGARSYIDANPLANTNYYYRLKAKNICGDWSSSYSATISPAGFAPGAPPEPTNVTAMVIGTSIKINWTDNSTNETGFIIERTTAGGGAALISNVGVGITTFTDNSVLLCQTYTYTVKAKSTCYPDGIGTKSASAIVTPALSNTFDANSLQGSKGYFPDKVQLEWTTVGNVNLEYIHIRRRILGSGEPFTLLFSMSGNSSIYNDVYAEAGVLYEYQIQGESKCESASVFTNTAQCIGFRLKTGVVTGQVHYAAGVAVKDVKITCENAGGITGKSLLFNNFGMLSVPSSASLELNSGLLLEMWMKPDAYSGNFKLIEKPGSYSLSYDHGSGNYIFQVFDAGSLTSASVSVSKDLIMTNNYSHLAAQVYHDSLQIFVNGNLENSIHIPASFSGAYHPVNNANAIAIGTSFIGNLDEIRLWKLGKGYVKMRQDFSRWMIGNETGLICYLRANEGLGSYAYDISKNGNLFNKNHAAIVNTVEWSDVIPSSIQLSIAAYTDKDGNYVMSVPYMGAGEVFVLLPSYLTHEFDPGSTALFVGDGALVHSNINFTDISSFQVQGAVHFKNTSCGVADAFLKIDGDYVIANGSPAKTDAIGSFDIQVPIGEHVITIEKDGHGFSIGRFPSSGKYDFQEDLAGIEFEDSTLVKVVGRVVGGLREGNKVPGLGKSKNNIGIARLIFKSQQGNGCSTDTLFTDTLTGEYIAYLPPLKYLPTVQIPSNPAIQFGVLNVIDLSGKPERKTEYDTLFDVDQTIVHIDSIVYHTKVNYIYRVDPQIAVFDTDGKSSFIGDTLYTFINGKTQDTTKVNLKTNPFRWPVFTQQDDEDNYICLITVFEEYLNYDKNPVVVRDSVPTSDGMLVVNNEISELPHFELPLALLNSKDTLKSIAYPFKAGLPNFNQNVSIPDYSYTRKFEINYIAPGGKAIPWWPVTNAPQGGDKVYRAYVLGQRTTGDQFVTFGPQVPEYILRDPPGSASTASREIGTTKVESTAWSWNQGKELHNTGTIYTGVKFDAGSGFLNTETDLAFNIAAGFSVETSGGRQGHQTQTTTNTNSWSTYGGTGIAPGASSDLYIGKSKNLQFGIAEVLVISPDLNCNEIECLSSPANGPGNSFSFAKQYGLAIVPGGYQTQFNFNEYDIINLILPNLRKLRNVMLQTNAKYVSHLDISDDNYGRNNDDPVFGSAVSTPTPFNGEYQDLDGPSYKYSAVNLLDSLSGDSVRIINQQIFLWEDAIRLNEWEKVNIGNPVVIDSLKNLELDRLEDKFRKSNEAYEEQVTKKGIVDAVNTAFILVPLASSGFLGIPLYEVATGIDVALAKLVDEHTAYLNQKQRILDKFSNVGAPSNFTLTGGTTYTSAMSHSGATSITRSIEYGIAANLDLEAYGKVSNLGAGFNMGVELKYTSGREWSVDEEESETVSFTLNDPDIGDLHSIDVFPSLLGWGPIFKNKAGGYTSCPFEPETTTSYYEPGTIISARSLQIDKPSITASPTILTNVPSEEAAVFNLTISNESEVGYIMNYDINIVGQSNPFGAIVRIDGFPEASVVIAGASSVNKVLSIQKGPGAVYNYDSILVVVHSQCQYTSGAGFISDIVDSVYVSAHFLPSCTKVGFSSPEDKWVLNQSFHDTLPISIIDYNINFDGLKDLRLDYKPSSQANWISLQKFYKDTSGLKDPKAAPIPTGVPYTLYNWDVSQLTDGSYDLRMVSQCELAEKNSITHSGIIDRINPHAFGTPSPADGILSPNDEISIRFNEPVDLGSINPALNFDIRGVTNGTATDHSTSLYFDGVNDCLNIQAGIPLDSRDFTLEFSIKRDGLGQQTIFSQGVDVNERISLGFDANNKLVFTINNSSVTSTTAITDKNWHYIALSYNYKNETAFLYQADGTATAFVINNGNSSIAPDYIGNAPMLVGKNSVTGNQFFKGNIHEVRVWNTAKSLAEFSLYKSKLLSGNEPGLLYNWRMDEAYGTTAIERLKRRDATISGAVWQISPNGFASDYAQPNAYLKVNSENIAITDEMDFTLEFWFKSNQAGVATLFSNGTGTGLSSDSLSSWNIERDASGIIHVKHHKMDFMATTKNYFDGEWHHFAMVLQRTGSLSTYIDGAFEASKQAVDFSQLGGSCMYLAAWGYTLSQTETLGNYFKGQLDEFRFWNLARTVEQIKRDKQNRMAGNELGLLLYLPFESYALDPTGIPILTQTFTDQATVKHTITPKNGAALVSTTPTIKIQRPVQQIAFQYSVNNDQIILTPTTSPEIIENVTLDITVSGIKDLHGNTMQSPVSWIAYVDKNQVVWQDDLLKFSTFKGEGLSFTSAILNKGGSIKKFDIVDIPSWLTVSPSSGSIAPNSILVVSFKIDPNVNLGQYNVNVSLLTDFNYKEKLGIDLKVNAREPEWKVEPAAYEHTMSIIGQIKINGIWSTDVNDKLMAMVGQEIRGVANVEYVPQIDAYRVFLNVFSNTSSGELLSFRVWDASAGKIYTDVTVVPSPLNFDASLLVGTLVDPKIFSTNANVSYEIPVRKGWNWLSFFLNNPVPTDLNSILASVSQTTAQIKNRDAFANYSSGVWTGSLNTGTNPYGIRPESMYKLYLNSNDTLILKGTVVNPTLTKINLSNGWTWIGFVSIRSQSVTQALGGLNASVGDLIKGKTNFAVYNGSPLGWIGSLKTMIPGEGYMYKSNGIKSFYYPIAGMFDNFTDLTTRSGEEDYWEVDHSPYLSNMTIIAEVPNICSAMNAEGQFGIAYKDGAGNWRAKSPIEEFNGKNYVFLTVAGDQEEMLHAYLLDRKSGMTFPIDRSLLFRANDDLGSLDFPYSIELPAAICEKLSTKENEDRFVVYPHVFEEVLTMEYNAAGEDPHASVRISNLQGKVLFVEQVELRKGFNARTFDVSKLHLNPGAYVFELMSSDKQRIQKIIKSN